MIHMYAYLIDPDILFTSYSLISRDIKMAERTAGL